MSREAQYVLLLLLGGALIKITVDGSYLRYVKPIMAPFLLAAGAVIVALAVIAIVRDIRASRADGAGASDAHCCTGHDHASRGPWLLVVPVLAIFLVAPPALGSDAAARGTGRTVAAPTRDDTHRVPFPPLPAGNVVAMRFSDLVARAGYDSTGTLDRRTVRITGFVTHDESGQTLLAPMVMACCAADAFPVHALLNGDTGRYPEDQWLVVTGTVVPGTATTANGYTPTLTVQSARPIPTPRDTYEY